MGKQEHDLSGLVDSRTPPPPIGKAAARLSQRKQLLSGAPRAAAGPWAALWITVSAGRKEEILGGWLECEKGEPGRVRKSQGVTGMKPRAVRATLLSVSEAQLKEGPLLLLLNVGC